MGEHFTIFKSRWRVLLFVGVFCVNSVFFGRCCGLAAYANNLP